MKTAYTWLALTALVGYACASGSAGPSTGLDNLYLSMPSPSLLVSRYLVYRRAVMQARPDVLVCIREFSDDDVAHALRGGWAPSVRVDPTCRGARTGAGGSPLLVIERVVLGSDTSRAFATYYQDKHPKAWKEEFVWFRPPLQGDWRLIVGQFALPH